MAAHHKRRTVASKWMSLLATPVLALLTFVLAYWLDPLHFKQEPLSTIPAFMLSAVVLLVGQAIVTEQELRKTSVFSDRIYDAIKDYLHVTPVGPPEQAFRYISGRIPVLREVKNTSFNLKDEAERSDEKFYETPVYLRVSEQIPVYCSQGLLWKDITDSLGISRLRSIKNASEKSVRGRKSGYHLKVITHNEPQINFVLLEYEDGTTEVLFNWDFRAPGQDPIVLISRDRSITGMFAVHFDMLWHCANEDHDSHATMSTSTK